MENKLKNFLTDGETSRAAGFRFAHDQRRFVIRRAVLRLLLASYLGMGARFVRLMSGQFGKPFISGQNGPDGIRFSCSHSADLGLIAVAQGLELGSDLEQHRELTDAEELADACFCDSEVKELTDLPSSSKMRGFFNCWTRKEAFVKAIGLGFSFPLNRFSVSLAPGKPAALLDVAEDHEAVRKWTMTSLDVSENYSAAIVFEGKNASLQYFEWIPQQFY